MLVPEHVLARYSEHESESRSNSAPGVTDGPFRFQQWVRGDRITLTANDAFFLGKRACVRSRFTDPRRNTAVDSLRTHAVDYVYQPSIVTNEALRSAPGVHIVWVNANGYEGLG